MNANSVMGKLCTGRRGSVAKTCSAVPGTRHSSVVANRAGLMATNILKNRSDRVYSFAGTPGPSRQPVGLDGCVRQESWKMRRHHELFPLSCIDRPQRSKGQDERKEERGYHDQPKSRTDCRGCFYQGERGRRMSEMRPRTLCLQHRFGTDSTLSWMDSRRNTVYTDQSMPQWSHNPWRVAEYQPYRRWKFSEWFWWPRNTSKTRRWHTGPGAIFGGKPSFGTGTIRSVAISPPTIAASPVSTAAHGVVDNGSLASASRERPIQWGPMEYGYGNGSDWCVLAQSNTTSEPESMNHQQDWCGNAKSNDKLKDEPVLTASHVLKEHTFEIRQEDEVPELAAAIRECGIWPRPRSPSTARDRSREVNVLSQDTLLGGATERVKLDDASDLNVLDNSDFADFIHHHAWFEGDEVALPRGDRVYLLGSQARRQRNVV